MTQEEKGWNQGRMKSATQLLCERVGAPSVDATEHDQEPCWLCGGDSTRGLVAADWVGGNFTDYNRVASPSSVHVCVACVYVCSRTSPVPGRPAKEGKSFGANFRNVSHMLDATGYTNASKGEKPAILAWLRSQHRGPWFATIADTGQIHMLPFAPVNPCGTRRGVVLFERALVTLPVPQSAGWTLVARITAMLTAGATKEEISTGDYGPRAWQLCPVAAFEESWGGKRGSQWFDLALWLAQRDEAAVAERIDKEKANGKNRRKAKGAAANGDGGGAAGAAPSVPADPAGERAQELGHVDQPDPRRGNEHDEPGGMVHGDAARAEDRDAQPKQLRLFG